MSEKLAMNEVSLHTVVVEEGDVPRVRRIGWAVAVLVLVALVALAMMSREPATETGAGAIVSPANVAVEVEPPSATDDYAYYTERYWNAVEALPAVGEAADYAYYTERYWNVGTEEAADASAPGSGVEDYAYYTERYWQRGQER